MQSTASGQSICRPTPHLPASSSSSSSFSSSSSPSLHLCLLLFFVVPLSSSASSPPLLPPVFFFVLFSFVSACSPSADSMFGSSHFGFRLVFGRCIVLSSLASLGNEVDELAGSMMLPLSSSERRVGAFGAGLAVGAWQIASDVGPCPLSASWSNRLPLSAARGLLSFVYLHSEITPSALGNTGICEGNIQVTCLGCGVADTCPPLLTPRHRCKKTAWPQSTTYGDTDSW